MELELELCTAPPEFMQDMWLHFSAALGKATTSMSCTYR